MTRISNVAGIAVLIEGSTMVGFIFLYTMLFCFVNTHQYVNQKQEERILLRHLHGTRNVNPSYSSNLKLAAFNVQTFGIRKMNYPGVPAVLVKVGCVISQFISWNSHFRVYFGIRTCELFLR